MDRVLLIPMPMRQSNVCKEEQKIDEPQA